MNFHEEYQEKFGAEQIKSESTIRQGIQPKLVVAINSSNNASQVFVQALDKVLQRLSGFERVQVVGLDSMKDASTIKSMGVPVPGLLLIRGKLFASTSANTESALTKFFNDRTKLWR
jgi:hypothetical protein